MGNSFGKEDAVDFNGEVELRHFTLLRCVGKGAFGKVRIVEKRDTKKLYALKYINKLQCIRMRAIQNIFRERAILEEINHPFVVNLKFAFQDDENMFMVLDLMMGGDLRYHMDRTASFSEAAIRVMAAEMCSAIAYLHSKNIVHRDLKPDNVLLDEDGHAHLTDFNIAVNYAERKHLKSHSGTHAYMAPEIFLDKGYLWQIDWWSLGILLYELFYGKRPFRGPNNDAVTQAILHDDLIFPPTNIANRQPVHISPEGQAFVASLLLRDPTVRLGCVLPGSQDIFSHPFFSEMNWNAVEGKAVKPVFVPDRDRPNFDATHDLEELLLEDNPLTYKPRKKKTVRSAAVTAAAQAHMAALTNGANGSLTPPNGSEKGRSTRGNSVNNGRVAALTNTGTKGVGTGTDGGGQQGSGSYNGSTNGAQAPTTNTNGAGANIPLPPSATNHHAYNQLSQKDKIALDLQFIEDNFKSFDATVYENYPGIIDSTTLRVGDPPPWVTEAGKSGPSDLNQMGPQPSPSISTNKSSQQLPMSAYNFDGDMLPQIANRNLSLSQDAGIHQQGKNVRKAVSGGNVRQGSSQPGSASQLAGDAVVMGSSSSSPGSFVSPGNGGKETSSSTPSLMAKLTRRVSRSGSASSAQAPMSNHSQTLSTSTSNPSLSSSYNANVPPVPKIPSQVANMVPIQPYPQNGHAVTQQAGGNGVRIDRTASSGIRTGPAQSQGPVYPSSYQLPANGRANISLSSPQLQRTGSSPVVSTNIPTTVVTAPVSASPNSSNSSNSSTPNLAFGGPVSNQKKQPQYQQRPQQQPQQPSQQQHQGHQAPVNASPSPPGSPSATPGALRGVATNAMRPRTMSASNSGPAAAYPSPPSSLSSGYSGPSRAVFKQSGTANVVPSVVMQQPQGQGHGQGQHQQP
ncbi:hypothetical protein HDU97_008966 [Phlyctochytrium planicorne]|nr:hypothetical protein HDU97_008966 [Phlyctochytrium planicorne]